MYLDHLNSLAVELCEAGRIQEAGVVSRIVLASPYAFAYPEWCETGKEIALRGYKSRSSIRITEKIPGNLLYLPEPSPATSAPVKSGRARVLSLKDWKKKMVKENDEKDLDEMNDKDLFMEIMRVASQDSITSKKLRKMVDAIKKIASEED